MARETEFGINLSYGARTGRPWTASVGSSTVNLPVWGAQHNDILEPMEDTTVPTLHIDFAPEQVFSQYLERATKPRWSASFWQYKPQW
jgi:hypothetical protein